jgi:transposase
LDHCGDGGRPPPARPADRPERFDYEERLKRESKGRSLFALQYQLDTTLSDAERYLLRQQDLVVLEVSTVVAEIGDFRRFAHARQLMAYLGLAPSEHSSGSTIRRGGITKAGNALVRRVLIEGAWTCRMNARVSRKLHDRLEPLSAVIRDIAWKAQVRLCAPYRRLAAAGKPKVVVTTAIAREMAGFIWAIARIAQPALD